MASNTFKECRRFSGLCGSALSSSGNWSTGEPEGISDLEVDTFELVYHGWLYIDRRYAPSVFHWLAKKLLRLNKVTEKITAHISRTNLQITERYDHSIITQEHSFDAIYRLSRLRHCDLDNYFAYIIHEKPDTPVCTFHVYQCNSTDVKAEFLKSLKTRVLEFQKISSPCQEPSQCHEHTPYNITPPLLTHKRAGSSGPVLVSSTNSDVVFRDSVYYIGKVTISQAQAPPKFIDDVLIQLTKMHSARPRHRTGSGSSSDIPKKTSSFDLGMMAECKSNGDTSDSESGAKEVEIRTRSITMLDNNSNNVATESIGKPSTTTGKDTECVKSTLKEAVSEEELKSIQEEVNCRLVTLHISKMYLMLFSVGDKTMLLEKKINNISFCTKGDARSDHFGFICREAGSHVCYIFQGDSEQKVEAIMKAMKQAFNEALDASAHLTLCESCPLQILHKLCTKLEGATSLDEKENVVEECSNCLSEYEQLHIMEQVNEKCPASADDRIEIHVNVLREVFDGKQLQHKHTHRIPNILADGSPRERPRSATFLEKAKKSLSISFQSFTQKKVNGAKPISPIQEPESKPRSRSYGSSENFPGLPTFNGIDSTDSGERRRSRHNSGCIEEMEKNVPEKVEEVEEGEDTEDTYDGELKSFTEAGGDLKRLQDRKGSWRQAIYHSVHTSDARKGSTVSVLIEERESDVDPHERARGRWKQAINNQILLIRMDRENKKLAANIKGVEERREKMSYVELGMQTADCTSTWDDIISHNENEKLDNHILFDAVRNGVPKSRRGDIWKLLIKQYMVRAPDTSGDSEWRNRPLKTLLKQDTNHQHAILIDLGRTFPTYDYFVTRLGPGQLGLFNMLKAYSLLDKEVGYCQGLSFVAGLLLMHMCEEDAFQSFCHIMFDLKIRRQYKPDMSAVQQQLYQLSRLLHDYHPKLTEHLNYHDVTPTLYAAPWFLTLYASQYPIGFVARVMDLLLLQGLEVIFKVALILVGNDAEGILKCDSFETIVDYMKTTIPEKVIHDCDDICTRALEMDIKQQLNLYEVEYQLLHEELIDVRQSRERLEKQELAQKQLEEQVSQLTGDLENANETIANLRSQLDQANRLNMGRNECLNDSNEERDSLNYQLTNSHSPPPRHLLNQDYEAQMILLITSPDSNTSINSNDVDITINNLQTVNGELTPSLDSGICADEVNANKSHCLKMLGDGVECTAEKQVVT